MVKMLGNKTSNVLYYLTDGNGSVCPRRCAKMSAKESTRANLEQQSALRKCQPQARLYGTSTWLATRQTSCPDSTMEIERSIPFFGTGAGLWRYERGSDVEALAPLRGQVVITKFSSVSVASTRTSASTLRPGVLRRLQTPIHIILVPASASIPTLPDQKEVGT